MSLQRFMAVPLSRAGNTDSESTASFRDWTLKVHNAILACGFVDVSSSSVTGADLRGGRGSTMSFSGAAPPTGNLDVRGFVVYGFNDPLQSQSAIYFKVEYGSDNQNGSGIGVWTTVGTYHNGTGSIMGPQIRRLALKWNVPNTNAARPCIWFLSGDATGSDPYICFAGPVWDFENKSSLSFNNPRESMFAIERSKNVQGTASIDGFSRINQDGVAPAYEYQAQNCSGSILLGQAALPFLVNYPSPITTSGSLMMSPAVLPEFGWAACTSAVLGKTSNVRHTDIVNIAVYPGKLRPYMMLWLCYGAGTGQDSNCIYMRCD